MNNNKIFFKKEVNMAVNQISNLKTLQKKKKQTKYNQRIEVKNNLTIARGEGGRDSGEKGFQELL